MMVGCGRNPCSQFARAVCEQAPNTPACDRASRTTNSDECLGLMKDVARFIALANEKVETPVLQPPAPPAAPEAAVPAPAPSQETPPQGTTPTQGAPTPPAAGAASPEGDGSAR